MSDLRILSSYSVMHIQNGKRFSVFVPLYSEHRKGYDCPDVHLHLSYEYIANLKRLKW